LIALVRDFNIPMKAIINKSDINISMTQEIEHYLEKEQIMLIEKLPFHEEFVEAMVAEKTIIEYQPDAEISQKFKTIWKAVQDFS
ncbi:MAG: (4Fe-4S)-binding protein, partial [Bacteroidales bacterium]|nr:(4Fe-4S)-binding protein [Bacteroidales bacterium]